MTTAVVQTVVVVGGMAFVILACVLALLVADDKVAIPGTSRARLMAAEDSVRIADLRFKQAQIELNAFELEQRRYDLALGQGDRA